MRVPSAPAEHPSPRYPRCHHDAAHDGLHAPCDLLAIAWRWDARPEGRAWYPVCRKHARGRVAWPTPAQCKAAGQPHRRPTAKPKGPTRTAQRKQCDDLWRELIRSEGRCLAAGFRGECSDGLQAAHVVSRKHDGTRWNPANGVPLCSRHHLMFTHDELTWEVWREKEVGVGLYNELRAEALAYVGPPDYASILADLTVIVESVRIRRTA